MATNWIVPTAANLNKILSQLVLNATNANTNNPDTANSPIDTSNTTRDSDCLQMVINQIRSAIIIGGREPLSVTTNAIPPEAEQHALVLAANLMTAATPNVSLVVVSPNGSIYAPFGDLVKEAKKWIIDVRTGLNIVNPSDPTGQDYSTAISPTNPAIIGGVNWGDSRGQAINYATGIDVNGNQFQALDLTTDG
jgi:hypothetical protein